MQIPRLKLPTLTASQALMATVFGLPLLFVPMHLALNKPLKWGFLVTIACVVLALEPLRTRLIRNMRNLSRTSLVLLAIVVFLAVLSTLQSNLSPAVRVIGWDTEYLGLLSWLSFFVIALGVRESVVRFLTSRLAILVGAAVLLVSLLTDGIFLYYGFRFTGLLQQATSMGMYAAFVLLLSVWHLSFRRNDKYFRRLLYVVSLLAVVGVLLSQSRVAQFAAVVSCLAVVVGAWSTHRKVRIAPLLLAGIVVFTPLAAGVYFDRLRSEQVQEGFAYRADIYKSSVHDITAGNYVLGLGASGVPQTINSRNTAPAGIVESLDRGFVFLSAHDIFLDVALCFGLIAGIAFLLLSLQASWVALGLALKPEGLLAGCALLIFLLNGVFNVPSIEMTLILIVLIVALSPARRKLKLKNREE